MATPIMIYSRLNGNVIDIQDNSTQPGALLDAFPSKTHLNLTGNPEPLAANQTWEVLPNPDGPDHFIIRNPATDHCIDIHDNSTSRGASLEAWPAKKSDNQNQLWNFLPDPFGSGYFFIQNPQTGYVIEIENGSSTSGASLVVNPRRLFNNKFQLWGGTEGPVINPSETGSGTTFTAFQLAQPTANLKSTVQYVLLPTDQTKNLTGITVTLDIIEDLVADSFSVQINGNPPYPGPKGAPWQTQFWMQFGLIMQNNGLFLFTQVYPVGTPPFPGPLLTPSVQKSSPRSMLQLQNNTVPAGTQIILTLITDPKNNDYVTGISGKVFDKFGSSIGTPDNWSAIGLPTWTSNGPGATENGPRVQESDLAPLGAFQVVVVGDPDSAPSGGGAAHAHFTAGLGTITVTCTPDISAQLYWPNPTDTGTAETSNCYYGKVQEGYFPQIAQPFGLPSPKITSVTGDFTFVGTGLLPNSKLSASAAFTNGASPGATAKGTVYNSAGLVSQNDGSFSVMVYPPDNGVEYTTVSTTVYDVDKNWATGVVPTFGPPGNLTSSGGLSP